MHTVDCHRFVLTFEPQLDIHVTWHRFGDQNARFVPGFTGRVLVHAQDYPQVAERVGRLLEFLRRLISGRESSVWGEFGISDVQLTGVQIEAMNPGAWHQLRPALELQGGIGLQYRRLRGCDRLPPHWDGSLLVEKREGWLVVVNSGDVERVLDEKLAVSLLETMGAAFDIGSVIAGALDGAEPLHERR